EQRAMLPRILLLVVRSDSACGFAFPYASMRLPSTENRPMQFEHVQEAAEAVRARWHVTPRAGIILGTGLGGLVEEMTEKTVIPYGQIPHFPESTAPTHAGQLVCGKLGD